MAGLAVERVVHAQFLFVIHRRVAAEGVIVRLHDQLAVARQIGKFRGDIHFARAVDGGVNRVLNFQLRRGGWIRLETLPLTATT